MAIKLLTPTINTQPAPGDVDTIAGAIASVIATAGPIGDLALRAPVLAAANAMERLRRWQWRNLDTLQTMLSTQAPAIKAARERLTTELRSRGMDPYGIQGEVAKQDREIRGQLVAAVAEQGRADGTKVAEVAADMMRMLTDEIDRETLHYIQPAANGESLEEMLTIERAKAAYRVRTPGELRAMWDEMRRLNEPAKACERFIECTSPWLTEVREMAAPKLAGRFGQQRTGDAGDQRDVAWSLLRAFEVYRRESIPGDIIIAQRCREALSAIYSDLCGIHGKFLSTTDFEARFLRAGGAGVSSDPYEIDPSFVARYLTGHDLPGWSPIVLRASSGAPIRKGRAS